MAAARRAFDDPTGWTHWTPEQRAEAMLRFAGAIEVLDDVDMPHGMKAMFGATLLNNGQTCFISTRILTPRTRYAEVVDAFTALASSLRVGDPLARSSCARSSASSPEPQTDSSVSRTPTSR